MGDSNDPILRYHTYLATLANHFSTFFSDKIQHIKANIVVYSSRPPSTEQKHYEPKLASFQPITTSGVRKLILSTPNNSCDLDPIPTTLLKRYCTELLAVITSIINGLRSPVEIPSEYRLALVRPIIKNVPLTQRT